MAATIALNNIVTKYFDAWLRYDTCLLKEIFDPSANYIIRNKQYTFSGINKITNYWLRNKGRQRNLSLIWSIVRFEEKHCAVVFQAKFYDIEEDDMNVINGVIDFFMTNTNQIGVLSEEYSKN